MSFRVGCAGIIVDDTFCGPLPEMPPEGLLVTVDQMPMRAGGCAANAAIGLAKQGVSVDIAGCVGQDAAAKSLLECLKQNGVGSAGVVASSLPTSKTIILLIKGEDRRYIHLFGANAAFSAKTISKAWLKTLDIFYLGGLFALPAMTCAELAEVFSFCRENGVKTVLDVVIPHGTPPSAFKDYEQLLRVTDYFLPNDTEAEAITGPMDLKEQLAKFIDLGVGTVVITRGHLGAVAARGGDYWECGCCAMECVDPSGAGDAFTAGIIASIGAGRDMPALLRYASVVGASATRAVGTTDGVMSTLEAEAFVASHPLKIKHAKLRVSRAVS